MAEVKKAQFEFTPCKTTRIVPYLFMQTNIFSVAGRAAQLREITRRNRQQNPLKAHFEGVPAFNATKKHFRVQKNYILHIACIVRVASRGIRVYNFG